MRAFALVTILCVAGCKITDPAARLAQNVEDAADTRADAIRRVANEQAGDLGNRANAILAKAVDGNSYAGQVRGAQSDALRAEAALVRAKGRGEARTVRARGEADAAAIRAR